MSAARGLGPVLAQRLGLALLTLVLVSLLVFGLTNLLPGDAAQEALGQAATPEAVAALRTQLGLDQPGPVRYVRWASRLLQGDAGQSLSSHKPVTQLIGERLPNSLKLAGITAAVAVPLALTLGLLSGVWRGSRFDRLVSLGSVALVSVPEFLVATMAVLVFAVQLHWLPALSHAPAAPTALAFLKAYALPVFTLCCVVVAQMARMTRAAVVDQLDSPYVEMARLKGLSASRVVLRHVLPNAVGPMANAMALSLSYLLGGVIVVEIIFSYPGIATLMVDAVSNRDMPLIQCCAMVFCTGYLCLVTSADLFTLAANPRLRKP